MSNLLSEVHPELVLEWSERNLPLTPDKITSTLLLELRRGTLTISVLSQMNKPKYGYALVQSLEEKGVAIDPNTLYPLLRRLESQQLLESKWETSGTKPRKYYQRTEYGTQVYEKMKIYWKNLSVGIERLLEEEEA